MSDGSGMKAGAAAGAGGIGLAAILRVCSHEGAEVGLAARAVRGAERGVVAEGAIGARGASRASRLGEGVALRGVGVVAADGERLGAKALELLPNLADLPISIGEDDEPSNPALSVPSPRPDPDAGSLLERALRHGDPLANHERLAMAWGHHPGERATARPISSTNIWAFRHDAARRLNQPTKLLWLAPRSGAEHERMFGAHPTAAEEAAIEAGTRAAAEIEAATRAPEVTSRAALMDAIVSGAWGSVMLIAGWSRGTDTRLLLRDGNQIREGDIHAACFASHAICIVLRRAGARGDARGAFAGADAAISMVQAARAQGLGVPAHDMVNAMLEARMTSMQADAAEAPAAPTAAPGPNSKPAPSKVKKAAVDAGAAPPPRRASAVSLTMLSAAAGTTYVVNSEPVE